MTRRAAFAVLLLGAAACGGRGGRASTTPTPQVQETASNAEVDTAWAVVERQVRHGKWSDAQKILERVLLELQPGDPRIAQAHYYLGEAHYAQGSHLEAAREFRKTSDDTPNDPLAADALLRVGDVYADLWRRPELDPSYGQTALATYQELVNRYPGTNAASRAQARIADLQERFAYKEYRAALYYFKLKAYDSAILYLKDVVATYPRAAVASEALVKLVQAYQKLGYKEDVEETCGYIRRFHPDAAKRYRVCLTDSTGAS
ncbi:MAG TPA: outer membrane protein assembly factor BamD [Gemmatimonadales bacterium]|jgi:outer membrane protein assembly factor BamD|nr:outer membrane protein assembly factor BamD [Gemmatimonadales bacterium]